MRYAFTKYQQRFNLSIILTLFTLLILTQSASAHHPFGGKTPSNLFEGFFSGLGHPIIGLDHFAFIIASGLLGTRFKQGFLIPIAFVVATMEGTGIHLQEINLPLAEGIIAASVIIFGGLLALKNNPLFSSYISMIIVATVAMIAGVFHGYAYGEAIIGAEMNPLVAYLAGFATIQLLVAFAAFGIGKVIMEKLSSKSISIFRIVGLGITAVGLVFLGVSFSS
ncbi:HupE/UreJ family protein [Crocosphaera sp. XPORK-15E]|uniref:HupE/UreJ family protein n=1 Tax=Crocosphaera sp. XPORK-15E TaxID=3110247 RepID=UPI002B20F4DD|nr:HupE/UreJ family protein [Crocosphaera sp. XPORK-15E]MEA5533248.1 HupE/UreJ family protein [Crocosphaera sp. XPORK-15E]